MASGLVPQGRDSLPPDVAGRAPGLRQGPDPTRRWAGRNRPVLISFRAPSHLPANLPSQTSPLSNSFTQFPDHGRITEQKTIFRMRGGGTRLGGRGGSWWPCCDSRRAGSPEAETAEYHCSVVRAAGERNPGFQDSSACWDKAAWGFWRFRPRSDLPAPKMVTDSAQGPGEGNPASLRADLAVPAFPPRGARDPPIAPTNEPRDVPPETCAVREVPQAGQKELRLSLKRPDMKDRDEQAASSVFIFPQLGRAALHLRPLGGSVFLGGHEGTINSVHVP